VHLGSAHSRARPARPSPLGRFGPRPKKQGRHCQGAGRRRRRPILASRRPGAGGEGSEEHHRNGGTQIRGVDDDWLERRWRAPAQRSWCGDELERRSWRRRQPQRIVRVADPRGGARQWKKAMASSSRGDRRGGGGRRCCSSGEATRGGMCDGTVGEEAALGGQGRGSEGAEWCGVARRLPREEKKQCIPWTDNATVTHRTAAACAARGGDVAAPDQQLAGSANYTGGSDRGWHGQNYDPTGTVAMSRAQFTAELIFQYSNYL
jgi:hypothetical protein